MEEFTQEELKAFAEPGTKKQEIIGAYFEKLGEEKVNALKPKSEEFQYIQNLVKTTKASVQWYVSKVRTKKLTLALKKPTSPPES